MINTKLLANLLIQLLLKFSNFWPSSLTSTSVILALCPTEISEWTDNEKPKDMTILELELAKVLTIKVVHKDPKNALVKLRIFGALLF